ncbi:hypothetical protein [Streptomyces nigrescens]|uniref:hypothetical protein n=1 Tax=Streptomyces nigrescens TaxID=1920 RepID=UPI003481290A
MSSQTRFFRQIALAVQGMANLVEHLVLVKAFRRMVSLTEVMRPQGAAAVGRAPGSQ